MKCGFRTTVRKECGSEIGKRNEREIEPLDVAMTRATGRLMITCRKRQIGQPIIMASRFLGELGFRR
jgi:superfamily I DNA/RNA helicase